jgi:hypothetical protein
MKKSTLIAGFDQAAHEVDTAFPSLFTKEDVIKVLWDLEQKLKAEINKNEITTKSLTEAQIKEIAKNATLSIASEGMDLVEDYELSMSYREVELDSLTLDESRITNAIERVIADWFESNEDNN